MEIHVPSVTVNFVPAKAGDIIKLGAITCRVIEDGSRTDNRIGCAEFTLPPNTAGPPAHWHEMHDEIFLTTAGTVRFHLPGASPSSVDAGVGDTVTVPIRAPHTFSNPFDNEARFFNTYTPAFYINYFKLLGELVGQGEMTREKNEEAMKRFATISIPREYLEEKAG